MPGIAFGSERGMSLLDTLVVVAVVGILGAVAVPTITTAVEGTRLAQAAREVERELQWARSRAVGKGRPMRVRFNCPGPGQYRVVELIGSPSAPAAADGAADRCNLATYPYPAADENPATRPNLDGPLRRLEPGVAFGLVRTIEFWPDGTAHYDANTAGVWPLIPPAGVAIRVDRKEKSSTIRVNGVGRITLNGQ